MCSCAKNRKKWGKKERSLEDLKLCIGCCEGKVTVVVIRDMNNRAADREMESIVGKFEVLCMNRNGGKLTDSFFFFLRRRMKT